MTKQDISFKKFLVLLNNIDENSKISNIIKLRLMNPAEIKSVELKRYRDSILLDRNNDSGDALIAFAENIF